MEPFVGIVIILIFSHCATTCIIKEDRRLGPWEGKKYRRKLADCDCSPTLELPPPEREYIDEQVLRWTVYIHLEGGYNDNSSVCIGTIITSNLIATSHKCVAWETKKINFFDSWSPKLTPRSSVQLNNIKVSDAHGNPINIDRIIYHPRYIESVQSRFLVNDVVLLRMTGAVTNVITDKSNLDLKPICVPTKAEAQNLLYIEPYYYGLDLQGRYKDIRRKLLLPGSECDKQLNKGIVSGIDSVCLKFDVESPEVEGGPIITTGSPNKHRFLTGIASWVGSKHYFDDWKFAYFSHVLYFVEYLEYQAQQLGSVWCRKPKAKFEEPKLPTPEDLEADFYHGKTINHEETLDCVCGRTNIGLGSPQGRIMGGVEAVEYEFGWMVKLRITIPGEGVALCGGSLINDRMILTAAHCVYDDNGVAHVKDVRAFISSHIYPTDPNEIEVKVKEVIVHPSYMEVYHNLKQYEYDIALFVLAKPLVFPKLANQERRSVVPICLPRHEDTENLVGKQATVAGWGVLTTNYTDNPDITTWVIEHPDKLHKLTKEILSLDECKKNMFYKYVSDNYICGSVGMDSDSAQGDSGGPLMIPKLIGGRNSTNGSSFHWIEVGLVSFGDPTYDTGDSYTAKTVNNSVGVYTNVRKFLSFINFHSNKHGAKWCKFETK